MFYSNCFFEAVKAKVNKKQNIKIVVIPPFKAKYNFFHFGWTDDKYFYHFRTKERLNPWQIFWYKGKISKFRLSRVERYHK